MRILLAGAITVTLYTAAPVHAQLTEPNDAGIAFGHVHLYVEDVALHGRLWSQLFGGTLIQKDRFTAVQLPGTLIFLTEQEGTTPSRGTVVDHFGLAVSDLQALLDSWRELGYEVDSQRPGPDGAPRAFITMPGGVRLELREDARVGTATMDHVHFFAPDNRELEAWYVDLFAATPGAGATDRARAAEVPGSALLFGAAEAERPGTAGNVIDHIGFEVEDIEAFAERLRSRGVQFEREPFYVEVLDLWVAFFNDPAGVLVEVTQGLDHY